MDPQLRAIESINTNLAVNAGAGTGKTKVLTERYIKILENGNLPDGREIESIVAITFTKKATEEMIERIRTLIKNNFQKEPKWRRYYRDMEKSNISTIHSFCAKLLRENPVEAEIDPLFEVIEEYSSKELLMKSIEMVLNNYLERDPLYYKLISDFHLDRIDRIYGDYINLYNSIRTLGLSFRDAKEISLSNLDRLIIDTEDINLIKTKTLYLMGKASKNSKIYKYQEDKNWIKLKNDEYSEDELIVLIESLKDSIGSIKGEEETINELKASINKILMTKDANFRDLYEIILDSLISIDEVYSNEKGKIGGLDYDDLQIKVLNLLDNEDVLERYREKYKYIMIDEFQDTNELQKKIFYKLSTIEEALDRNNLFVVGDPKQSIYAFRGADIGVFYQVIDDMKAISQDNIITLEKNYRSFDTVINFINGIFENLMAGAYDRLDAYHQSPNEVDIEVLENHEIEDNDEASVYEARLIAKRIKEMVEDGEFQYKDFALLFRSTTRNYHYEDALKKFGIPFYNSSSKRYFYRKEVLDILNALKAISNPYDSISMIGFLRGPMAGLSDDTIFSLLTKKDNNIYQSMKNVSELDLEDKEDIKVKNAYKLLTYFYSIKEVYTISHLLNELLEKTYFLEIHLIKEYGKQSLANINKFCEIAEKFDALNNKNLESFIDYIEKIRGEDTEEGVVSSENIVNLLTIHKSKGLQFPVVIIPELSRDIPNRFPRFLFQKGIGLGVKFEESSGIYDEIKANLTEKYNEEKKRIMYVAMTRGKNKLILGSLGKNKGYKKLLKEYLNRDEYDLIEKIDMESSSNVRSPKYIVDSKDENEIPDVYPNLLDLDNLGNRYERFSISQFMTYRDCKRKFYFDYINKIEFPHSPYGEEKDLVISGIDKGNIIHQFCQLYDGKEDEMQLVTEISQKNSIKLNNSIWEILKPYINNYKRYLDRKFDMVYIEKPFNIKIDEYYLSGFIDRINIKGEEIEIVDLKTNRLSNKEELIKQYTPQLRFYSYVVEKVLNRKVNRSSILFLENGEMIDIGISDKEVYETMTELKEFFEFVNLNLTLKSYDKSYASCAFCAYNKFCNDIEIS